MCCVFVYCVLYVMLGCCGGVYVDFSGGLWLLCWIMVVLVDVGPCTCMYQVILLSWCAQVTLLHVIRDRNTGTYMYHERHVAGV